MNLGLVFLNVIWYNKTNLSKHAEIKFKQEQESRMNEVILCKYGEIVLKGANRSSFEASLTRELRARAALYGKFRISTAQSTVWQKEHWCL